MLTVTTFHTVLLHLNEISVSNCRYILQIALSSSRLLTAFKAVAPQVSPSGNRNGELPPTCCPPATESSERPVVGHMFSLFAIVSLAWSNKIRANFRFDGLGQQTPDSNLGGSPSGAYDVRFPLPSSPACFSALTLQWLFRSWLRDYGAAIACGTEAIRFIAYIVGRQTVAPSHFMGVCCVF